MAGKNYLASKLGLILLALLLIFLARLKYIQYENQQAITKEKQDLINQASALEKKNQDLSSTIAYLNTSDFKEQVAHQQLDLKKQGEIVYNFSQRPEVVSEPANTNANLTNPQKWWQYFFK